MPLRPLLKLFLPYVWTLVPMYGTERLANYYFLGKDPAFYTISGLRLEVFIVCVLVGSLAAGAFLESFRLAAATQTAVLLSLLAGVFLLCDPRVCYSAAPDGLEPLRLGLFLGSVAAAGAAIGAATRGSMARSAWEEALVGSAGFFAVSWYPTIFTFAGTRLLPPLDPWATLVVLFAAAISTSAATTARIGRRAAQMIPAAALLLMLAVSAGIAWAYLGSLAYDLAGMTAVTIVGGVFGAAMASPGRRPGRWVRSGVPILLATSVALVLVMTLVFIPDAVSGILPAATTSTEERLSMGSPVYSGAYMDSPQGHSDGVAVTVSFVGTDAAEIQTDNFLSGGIGVHSAGCCVDGIDYAYRFDLFLFHGGNEAMVASGWEACDDNVACGGHSWRVLLFSVGRQLGKPGLDENTTLRMTWNAGELEWWYAGDRGRFNYFTSYQVPQPENHDFNTGVSGGVSLSPQKAAYFFQFGMTSEYPIGHGGWKVSLACPTVLADGSWACVPHARTLLGVDSYWKVIWRWGESYPDVALSPSGNHSAVFRYSSTNATGDFQGLW